MGPNPPPQMNAKCDLVLKLLVFGTQTHTHTRQKPIHPRYAGCNKFPIGYKIAPPSFPMRRYSPNPCCTSLDPADSQPQMISRPSVSRCSTNHWTDTNTQRQTDTRVCGKRPLRTDHSHSVISNSLIYNNVQEHDLVYYYRRCRSGR